MKLRVVGAVLALSVPLAAFARSGDEAKAKQYFARLVETKARAYLAGS
jgi:hypothetical protein